MYDQATAGELIRELKVFFPKTYDMNVAVNNLRRERGLKNWCVAAAELLRECEEGVAELNRGYNQDLIMNREDAPLLFAWHQVD